MPQESRRAALATVAAWLAPRPDLPPPPVAGGVAVVGELDRASGIGEGARLCVAGLRALGVPVWEAGPGRPLPPAGVPLVVHCNAAIVPLEMLRLGRALVRGRRIIGFWPWELSVAPRRWTDGFGYVHEVWAPSRFSAEAVRAAMPAGFGGRVVRVVPHPLAAAPPRPAAMDRAALGLPEAAVITLVVCSLASSFARKNPLAAIAAHRAAFGDRADRVLVMRVGDPTHHGADFARLVAAADGVSNIRLDTRIIPRDEASAVMAASDIVLSLHRSEGFGLVPAEAMLLEKPVVATAWSATEETLDACCGVPVPVRLVPAVDPRGVFEAPGAVWAEPDVAAAAAGLVRLADDAALRRRLGAAGRAVALRAFGTAGLAAAVRGLGVDVPAQGPG